MVNIDQINNLRIINDESRVIVVFFYKRRVISNEG